MPEDVFLHRPTHLALALDALHLSVGQHPRLPRGAVPVDLAAPVAAPLVEDLLVRLLRGHVVRPRRVAAEGEAAVVRGDDLDLLADLEGEEILVTLQNDCHGYGCAPCSTPVCPA